MLETPTGVLASTIRPMDLDADAQPISEARANLTDLVSAVRFQKRLVYLTKRDAPQAALIPTSTANLIREVGGLDAVESLMREHLGK